MARIPHIVGRPFGTAGMPPGVKESGQAADFRTDSFVIAIEKHGYRVAWTRACRCPCVPLNTQTAQSNPNCTRCHGSGYFFFGDAKPQDPALVGDLTDAQEAIVTTQNAFVIRAIMTSLSTDTSPFDKIGGWRSGQCNVTVRAENRLSYYDRLVAIDSVLAYHETVVCDTGPVLKTRYIITGAINLVLDQNFVRYFPDADFTITRGQLVWADGRAPAPGTRVTVHYMTCPTWLVTNYPHTVRNAYIAAKKPVPSTPEGDFYDLPVQATAKLEFLVHEDEAINP